MIKHGLTTWVAVLGSAFFSAGIVAQGMERAGADWLHHNGDAGASRFSTLDQINADNVDQLDRAWTFHTESGRFAGAPMIVDSVMYFSAPNGVFALDAVTGEQLWKYTPP